MRIRKKSCLHCEVSRVMSTGSQLLIACPYQSGYRSVTDECNQEATKRILLVGFFECSTCNYTTSVDCSGSRNVKAPGPCPKCGGLAYTLNPTKSEWITNIEEGWPKHLEKLKSLPRREMKNVK